MATSNSNIYQIGQAQGGEIVRTAWPSEGCDPKDLNDQKADVAVLKFEDNGSLVSEKEQEQAIHLIEQDSKTNKNGVIVVLFTHGWNHNASWDDSNFVSFRKILLRLALREAERYVDGKEAGRRIIGIYVGWRGLVHKSGIRQLFTFQGRYRTAKKIGETSSLQTSLEKIIGATKSLNANSPVILAGHSLGALMLESALASVLDPETRSGRDRPIQFPDLVLFLNSAADSEIAVRIQDHIKKRGPPRKKIDYEGTNFETPLFVSAASESDGVTKYLFRLGKFGSKTDGNTKRVFTHRLAKHKEGVVCKRWAGPSFGQSWHCLRPPQNNEGKLSFDIDLPSRKSALTNGGSNGPGECHVRYRLTQDKNSPFWIFQVPKDIVDGHNDIFNERASLLVMALIQVSGALMSLAIDYNQTFDGNDYDPD